MTAEIREAIAADGPIPFEQFMELALYGREGFYTGAAEGRAGRRGDFLTSPELGPLFGRVVARWLDAEWERLGSPEDFVVIDLGAGPGTLARSVLAAEPTSRRAMTYVAVELSASQRELHPAGVESVATLPDGPVTGVVLMNELLDNLPFRLLVADDGWREAFVDADRSGSFVEVLSSPLDPIPRWLPPTAPIGARAPLVSAARDTVESARTHLERGSVLAIDYGVARTAELAMRPWRDWLRTYRANRPGGHYLSDAGGQDVTTEVPFDQLPEPDAVRSQAQFLQLHGITDLVEEGRRVWREQAARPGVEALTMRSRVRESEALLDPNGLGAFVVAEWRVGG